MKSMTLACIDLLVLLEERPRQFADGQQAAPALLGHGGALRQQRGLVVDVQHARGVLGPLHVAAIQNRWSAVLTAFATSIGPKTPRRAAARGGAVAAPQALRA
jgi:hypothetical protein